MSAWRRIRISADEDGGTDPSDSEWIDDPRYASEDGWVHCFSPNPGSDEDEDKDEDD